MSLEVKYTADPLIGVVGRGRVESQALSSESHVVFPSMHEDVIGALEKR